MSNVSKKSQKPRKIDEVKNEGGSKRGLTMKQEKFCREYLLCMNASEAYRRAYDTKGKAENMVWVEASRLLGHPGVSLRVAELKENIEELCGISKQTQIKGLLAIIEANQGSPETTKAFAEINKMMPGYLAANRTELTGKDGGPIEHKEAKIKLD